jgi:hypothetical protein
MHGDGMGLLGACGARNQPDCEGKKKQTTKSAQPHAGALAKALEQKHQDKPIRGTAGIEPYHKEFDGERARERFMVRSKTLVGIDLSVGHVKKAGNRARAPSPSLIRLN